MEFTKILLLSETHRRPTWLIGDGYAPSETNTHVETHRRPICLQSPTHILIFKNILFAYLYTLVRTRIRNVGLRWDMSVSDEFPMKHVIRYVGLRYFFDGSPINMSVSNGSPIIIIFSWTLGNAILLNPYGMFNSMVLLSKMKAWNLQKFEIIYNGLTSFTHILTVKKILNNSSFPSIILGVLLVVFNILRLMT